MNTTIQTLISLYSGNVVGTRKDDVYEFVTVEFSDYPVRESFIHSLPAGVNWERGFDFDKAGVDLMILRTEETEEPAPVKPVRKPTAPMIDVMVRMFGGEEGGNMSQWTDTYRNFESYRKSTLTGLIARGFIQEVESEWTPGGLWLTGAGIAFLVETNRAVMVDGKRKIATTTPMTEIEISRHIRDAKLETALDAQDLRVVGDYFNNVNRRADVVGVARPGEKSRQWEIVYQVQPFRGEPSRETVYLVVNINDLTDYLVVPKSRLTNLY